jgi:transposase
MGIVAETYDYTLGVDTHARTHHLALVETRTGKLVRDQEFDTTGPALARAAAWAARHTAGGTVLAAVECVNTYGASITRVLGGAGIRVVEAKPPRRAARRNRGKSDRIDAEAAARSALALDADRLPEPRPTSGTTAAMGALLAERDRLNKHLTQSRNALTALCRAHPLGVDCRLAVAGRQIREMAAWDPDPDSEDPGEVVRGCAARLARAALEAARQLDANKKALERLVLSLDPGLLAEKGVGPVSAAAILHARGGSGRIATEAGFAALAGVQPVQASSGNTVRHRLCRGGDRRLNRALTVVARSRMLTDPETIAYVERRRREGKSEREAKRILKRYIARQLHRRLAKIGL